MSETRAVTVDVSGAATGRELRAAMGSALGLDEDGTESWGAFARSLTALCGAHAVVLEGLDILESSQPTETASLLQLVSAHNNEHPETPISLEASGDYRGPVRHLRLLARGKPNGAERGKAAFVSCWIKSSTAAEAEAMARAEIERAGWTVLEVQENGHVAAEDYEPNTTALNCYRQSLIDGEVYVFDEWDDE